MRTNEMISCRGLPCGDVRHERFFIPDIGLDPEAVSLVMISEAAAPDPKDNYYKGGDSLFERTTVQAFRDAGASINSLRDLLDLGVYLTSAVKCGKTGYGISGETVRECSLILKKELALFPNIKMLMLMGDVAIKVLNGIAKRAGEARVIPAGSTYKIRNGEFFFRGMRVLPSYLQAGPSFFIEKSKRRMIAEDIAAALRFIRKM